MPKAKRPPTAKSLQLRRARALKKQAHKREKRRSKIMAGLVDPFTAAFYDRYVVDHGADGQVPLSLVPNRQLRQRVRALNVETGFLSEATRSQGSGGEPLPSPVDSTPATSADPLPATTVPRRRGRQPPPCRFPLLPMMPDQPAVLGKILQGTLAFPVETGLGRRHRCPRCFRTTSAIDAGALTLHVFPTSAGDLVFRCHQCGFCLDTVEFMRNTQYQQTLVGAASLLMAWGHLSQPLPPEQLVGYERLAELRILFVDGRGHFAAARNAKGGRQPPLFGDWALLSTAALRRLFPLLRLPGSMPATCLARVSRDVFGRWSALHLHHPRGYDPMYRLELRDWEAPAACTWFLSRYADLLGGRELILCAESHVAIAITGAMQRWPLADHLPVALIDQCVGSLHESVLPFARVWAAVRGSRSARFALPLLVPTIVPGEPEVRVRRLPEDVHFQESPVGVLASRASFCEVATAPDAMEDLTAMIVAEKDHQPLSLVLADELGQPGLHAATRRRLLEGVSRQTGMTLASLVGADINPWTGGPYALNATGGTTYIARKGRYWRRGRRETEFTPVTNFVVHLTNYQLDARGIGTHHACLEISGHRVDLSLSSTVFDRPKRLLMALTGAATVAGLECPVIGDTKASRLLPTLIRATRTHRAFEGYHVTG